MRVIKLCVAPTIGSFLLIACVAHAIDPVDALLSNRQVQNGRQVEVRGMIGVRHGLINLFSRDREECVGLLVTDQERARYAALDGHMVTVSGTLQAEGCGREGICDEHLCGPSILTNVSVHPN